jgi:hypothetical protein
MCKKPANPEDIEVTAEMARIGAEIVDGYDPEFSLPWEVAAAAYRAMEEERRKVSSLS